MKNEKAALGASMKKIGPFKEMWSRVSVRPVAMVSLGIIVIIFLLAIFADVIYDYNTYCVKQDLANRYLPFSTQHLLGTDMVGRDVAARLVHGVRAAMIMGVLASAISVFIATILACVAAYYGGKVDNIIMRICDVLACIPPLVLAIAICAGLGGGIWQLVTALSFSNIVGTTRMIRSKAIQVANMEYMESATALGASTPRLMVKNILPNIVDMLLIVGTGGVAMNIMMGTTLSFVGLGVKSPQPEWGLMVNESISKMQLHPEIVLLPGLAIVITTLAIATLGDYLRDAFDPKLKGKA
jgi:peptide/nickel transport system permease protein